MKQKVLTTMIYDGPQEFFHNLFNSIRRFQILPLLKVQYDERALETWDHSAHNRIQFGSRVLIFLTNYESVWNILQNRDQGIFTGIAPKL